MEIVGNHPYLSVRASDAAMICQFLFESQTLDALKVAILIMDHAVEEHPRAGNLHLECAKLICYHGVRIMQAHPVPDEDATDTATHLLQVSSEYIVQAKKHSKGYSGFWTRIRIQMEQRRLERKLKVLERQGQVALLHGLLFIGNESEEDGDDIDIKSLLDDASRFHLQTLQEIKYVLSQNFLSTVQIAKNVSNCTLTQCLRTFWTYLRSGKINSDVLPLFAKKISDKGNHYKRSSILHNL